MSPRRLTAATMIGLVGAVAVIVGAVLPWVTIASPGESGSTVSFPSESTELNGLLVSSGLLLLLGIATGIAAGWLWAGNDPKKAIAALGPLSVGVVTFCVWAILKKDDAFGFGALGPDETASLKFGVYVTLAGGALALLAAIVAA